MRLQQKANFTPLAGCGAYAASTVPSCMTANTVLRLRSPFGQPVSHLADDGEAMCQGAHRGDCGAAAGFSAGLKCWPTRWSYSWGGRFSVGFGHCLACSCTTRNDATVSARTCMCACMLAAPVIVDSCICVHAEVHVAQGRLCKTHTTYVHVLSLNSGLYGHCAGQRQV